MELKFIDGYHENIGDIVNVKNAANDDNEDFLSTRLDFDRDNEYNDDAKHKKKESLIEVVENHENQKHLSSYHTLAWVSFVLCFPVGCIALIKSYQVKLALRKRRYEKAEDATYATKFYAAIAIVFGVITLSLVIAIFLGKSADI